MNLICHMALALIATAAQDPDKKAGELIRELRSEDADSRAAATQKLLKLGEQARKALESAAKDSDPEVVQRARRILDTLEKRKEYEKARQKFAERLKKLGLPEGARSLWATPLKDEDNAAPVLARAFERIKKAEADGRKALSFAEKAKDTKSALEHKELAEPYLKLHAPVVALLREAAGKKGCRFPIATTLQDRMSGLKKAQATLNSCALASLALGRHKDAREFCLMELTLARANDDELNMLSALFKVFLFNTAMTSLQEVCLAETPPAEALDRFERALKAFTPQRMVARALQGEALVWCPPIDEKTLQSARLIEGAIKRIEHRLPLLDMYIRAQGFADKPFEEAQKVASEIIAEMKKLPAPGKMIAQALENFFVYIPLMHARIRVARVGLAALRYRAKQGSLPEDLEALVPDYLKEIPKDPFSGEPLLYDGERVYSVGENKQDDGGERDKETLERDDWAFQLKVGT